MATNFNTIIRSPIWAVLLLLGLLSAYYEGRVLKAQNAALMASIKADNAAYAALQVQLTVREAKIDSLSKLSARQDSATNSVIIPPTPIFHAPKVPHPTAPDSVAKLLGAVLQGLH